MPADIVGSMIIETDDRGAKSLRFQPGPIFANLVLADEINRATPKTQSALLEAMQERTVTSGTSTHELEAPFLVMATQNPIEMEGTYPLPEAQLDRFLMKIRLDYPAAQDEREIIGRYGRASEVPAREGSGLSRLPEGDWIKGLRKHESRVLIEEGIVGYVQELLERTRKSPQLYLGASTRAGIALLRSSQCLAGLEGRDFITPDHIKRLSLPVLRHRVILRPEAELEGLTTDRVLARILEGVPVPR
jgi:MoxR-like ATPase